ncbi:FANCM protein, partial [Promerops cafer]|nr:FANCM protein [Promerops cafer]
MRGVYLSSVRSPALGSRYKMVHREFSPSAVFSQIPEQDEAYAEDSFCVGDEEEEAQSGCSEEEEEEECVDLDLLGTEALGSCRKQYLTRRRRRLHQARPGATAPAPLQRKKPSRIIVLSDSSEEETGGSREKPLGAGQGKGQLPKALPSAPSAQPRSGAGGATVPQPGGRDTERLLALEASGSGVLDLPPEHPGRSMSMPPAGSGCRNTDLQAAGEVYSSLKKTHRSSSGSACPAVPNPSSGTAGLSRVPGEHSPSLAGLSRVPGEHSPSLAGLSRVPGQHSPSLAQISRVPGEHSPSLAGISRGLAFLYFHSSGETSRLLQRTQYYDGVLSALVQAGIRILFSSCQEETAALLKDLALLEHRKDAAIQVPTEPEGHRRDLLSFYLSIPSLSYGAALNLCHSFGSIAAVANSSVPALAAGARLSRPQAEELHRFLRHDFDPQLLPQPLPAKGKS